MFEHPLPSTIKPVKFARQEGRLKGYMLLQQLTVLAADCVSEEGKVEADLKLHMDGARPELHGSASADIKLICQRCLKPVDVSIAVNIALGFVQTEEQASELPSHLEPFMLEEEEILLAQLLEQELILALPIVAYHQECEQYPFDEGEHDVAAASEKPNPFAVLEQLKGNVKKTDS